MAMAEKGGIRIPIITYYSDKGVKAASKGLIGLETAASKLAKTFGVALGAAAIVDFGKKSLDVFAKEQKAMTQLTNTLYNLGLAYDGIGVNQFLAELQDATGIAKDQLAPALQTLTTYTLNYAKAQELLNSAVNIAAANQLDVGQVADALAKAYAGNTKALVGLNVGITATEAKTESFKQIMDQLNSTFKDAALVDNYKTRLDKLKVAATDAMSYIGQGIAQALNTLTADGNITKTMETLRNFGKVISEEIVGFASGIKQLFKDISEIPIVKVILGVVGGAIKGLDKLLGISKAAKADIANFDKKMAADQAKSDAKAIASAKQQAALNAKLKAQQIADQKKLNAEKAKQIALDKASAVLNKAQSVFNLDAIELAAAAKTATGEDAARVKLKQDILALEDAIQSKNADLATKLAEVVTTDQQRLNSLIAQNAQLDKMVKSYDLIKSKDVVINFTATGLDAIQQSAYGSLGNRVTRTIAPESTATAPITSTTATVASVAAAASTAATAAASAATQVAQTVASVAATIASTAATDKDTKDAVTTMANVIPTLPETITESVSNGVSNAIDERQQSIIDASQWATFFGLTDFSASGISSIPSFSAGTYMDTSARPADVQVTIVDNTSGLIDVITDTTQQASANGINTRLIRNTGGLNW